MSRFTVAVGLALLPACGGGSDEVSCSYETSGVVTGCANYTFSGDAQGQDVTTLEQNACTSGGGTVVGSCSTANVLGTCTITDSVNGATVSAVAEQYAVNGLTAAEAQANCESENGTDGVTTKWSAK